LRQVICLIPCIWILPYMASVTGFCAPPTAIWLSMPISDVLACLATVPSFLSHTRFLARVGRLRQS
jgi:Na+-driven multidrug efflux pump